jgi:hypothetical protein
VAPNRLVGQRVRRELAPLGAGELERVAVAQELQADATW